MSDLNEVVAEWLRKDGPVAEVVSVDGYGTDDAGDTFNGFHARFEVTIHYVSESGEERTLTVEGDDMQSLWNHVMNSWPNTKESQ